MQEAWVPSFLSGPVCDRYQTDIFSSVLIKRRFSSLNCSSSLPCSESSERDGVEHFGPKGVGVGGREVCVCVGGVGGE